MSDSTLRTGIGGAPFAMLVGANAEVVLRRAPEDDDALRLEVRINHEGYHLVGRLDLPEDVAIRAGTTHWLGAGVGVVEGALLRVEDARDGEALVSPFFDDHSSVRLTAPVTRWEPCAELRLGSLRRRDPATAYAPLGLGERTTELLIAPTAAIPLSDAAGGPSFAELLAGRRTVLRALEEDGPHRRVLRDEDGVVVVGWASRESLDGVVARGSDEITALGALMGPTERCTAAAPITVSVEIAGAREVVGWLDPGASLTVGERREDDSFDMEPLFAGLYAAPGTRWIGASASPPTCVEVRLPGGRLGSVAAARPALSRERTLAAVVTASNVTELAEGARCELRLDHPEHGTGSCAATLRCGRTSVYASRRFPCDAGESGEVVTGRDASTSATDDSPAMSLELHDGAPGVVSLMDDESGDLGALRARLRIEPEATPPG